MPWSWRTGAPRATRSSATFTGRCSTTSSGSRDSGRASASSKWTTPPSHAGAAPPPTSSRSWGGDSRKRPREFPPPLERDELRRSRGAGERQRLLVSPSDFGRSMRIGGERDGNAFGDELRQEPRLGVGLADGLAQARGRDLDGTAGLSSRRDRRVFRVLPNGGGTMPVLLRQVEVRQHVEETGACGLREQPVVLVVKAFG